MDLWSRRCHDTVDGSEIQRSPVEVGSFFPLFTRFYTFQVVSRISSINSLCFKNHHLHVVVFFVFNALYITSFKRPHTDTSFSGISLKSASSKTDSNPNRSTERSCAMFASLISVDLRCCKHWPVVGWFVGVFGPGFMDKKTITLVRN